jgi:lycopene cyclase domain-containing protein
LEGAALMLPAGSYLAILILSLVGLYLLDRTHKLAFTVDAKRSLLSMVPAYILFLVWDIVGIATGIFFRGENTLLTGIQVLPEFPVEELFFLALLCYSTLIVFTWVQKTLTARESGGR